MTATVTSLAKKLEQLEPPMLQALDNASDVALGAARKTPSLPDGIIAIAIQVGGIGGAGSGSGGNGSVGGGSGGTGSGSESGSGHGSGGRGRSGRLVTRQTGCKRETALLIGVSYSTSRIVGAFLKLQGATLCASRP
jgi:hypothetical protein